MYLAQEKTPGGPQRVVKFFTKASPCRNPRLSCACVDVDVDDDDDDEEDEADGGDGVLIMVI